MTTRIQEFDYSVNLMRAMLWQYNSAQRLQALMTQKNFWYEMNQKDFWDSWYTDVFDLRTANAFGLAVWSYILDIPLFIDFSSDPDDTTRDLWGFNAFDGGFPDYINTYQNFEQGSFTTRHGQVTLTVEEQRLLLRLRYYQLVSRGATPDTNQFLSVLFADRTKIFPEYGIAYVLDGLDMTMTYVFNFNLSQTFIYIFQHFDIMPRPAGVKLKYRILNDNIFGFNELDGAFPNYININKNFENGTFLLEF